MSNIFVFERDDKSQGWLVQKREEFASDKIGECPRYRYNEDIPIGSELMEGKDFELQYQYLSLPDADHIWRPCNKLDYDMTDKKYRRTIAIPIKPIEQQDEQEIVAAIYEANRPRFHDWGTLKGMCIATAIQYANQKVEEYKQSNGEIERLKGLITLLASAFYFFDYEKGDITKEEYLQKFKTENDL